MKKFAFRLDTLNSTPLLVEVLRVLQGTEARVTLFRAQVHPLDNKTGTISAELETHIEKIPLLKLLLGSLDGVTAVSVKEETASVNFYSYGARS